MKGAEVEVPLTTPLTINSPFVTPTLSFAEKATLRLPLTKVAAVRLKSTMTGTWVSTGTPGCDRRRIKGHLNSLGGIHTAVVELLVESNYTEVVR